MTSVQRSTYTMKSINGNAPSDSERIRTLDAKMAEIHLKNQQLERRYIEVLEDKKRAEESNSSITNPIREGLGKRQAPLQRGSVKDRLGRRQVSPPSRTCSNDYCKQPNVAGAKNYGKFNLECQDVRHKPRRVAEDKPRDSKSTKSQKGAHGNKGILSWVCSDPNCRNHNPEGTPRCLRCHMDWTKNVEVTKIVEALPRPSQYGKEPGKHFSKATVTNNRMPKTAVKTEIKPEPMPVFEPLQVGVVTEDNQCQWEKSNQTLSWAEEVQREEASYTESLRATIPYTQPQPCQPLVYAPNQTAIHGHPSIVPGPTEPAQYCDASTSFVPGSTTKGQFTNQYHQPHLPQTQPEEVPKPITPPPQGPYGSDMSRPQLRGQDTYKTRIPSRYLKQAAPEVPDKPLGVLPEHLPSTTSKTAPQSCKRLTMFLPEEVAKHVSISEISEELKLTVQIIPISRLENLYSVIGEIDPEVDRAVLIHFGGKEVSESVARPDLNNSKKMAEITQVANSLCAIVDDLIKRIPYLEVFVSMQTPRCDCDPQAKQVVAGTANILPNSLRKMLNLDISQGVKDKAGITCLNNDEVLDWQDDLNKVDQLLCPDGHTLKRYGVEVMLQFWTEKIATTLSHGKVK